MALSHLNAPFIYVIPPILGAFIMIVLAMISILRGRRNPTNIMFAGICLLGSLVNINVALVSILPDKSLALRIDRTLYLFIVFAVPIFIHFVHSFLGITNRRWLEYLTYLFSFIILFFTPSELFISGLQQYTFGTIARAGPVFYVFAVITFCSVLYCLAVLFAALTKSADNQQRNRIKYILGGMGLGALLIALNILTVCGVRIYPMGNFSFVPAVFLAFGVLKYDLLDMGALIRRGTIYFILTGVLTALYISIIYLFNTLFMESGYDRSLVLPLLLAVIIVLIFNPLREKVQEMIDTLFFRGKYDYQKLLKEISGEMASLLKFDQIKELLLESVSAALHVTHVYLLVNHEDKDFFRIYSRETQSYEKTGIEGIVRDHPLVAFFESRKRPLSKSHIEKAVSEPGDGEQISSIFDTLDVSLIIPIVSQTGLVGMIALGQKKSGELFVHEDLELMTTIANQSVNAFENARSYEEVERLNRDLEKKVEERTMDLRQALEEKEKTQKQLIQSESLAAIGQLVAGTAHELNNPLAGAASLIQTTVESVAEWRVNDGNQEEVINDLEFSLKELKRAGDIVRSLLDLSRQTQVYVEPVDINVAMEDALRVLYNQYKHLPVEIERDYDKNLPPVEGNFANLGQVFINIIKNAFESLSGGHGKITLVTRFIESTDSVLIECTDTGRGIPSHRMNDIFKPFFTTKEVGKGTGLGLYISHEIIKRHGGKIFVRSEEGKGSTIGIELPCIHREEMKNALTK
jgi:two-component system NtrC family sensor kinase